MSATLTGSKRKIGTDPDVLNAFDAIAKKSTGSSKSKTTKIAASVTPDLKKDVDVLVATKAEIDALTAKKDELNARIIEHVRPQQDAKAYAGEFSKSFLVEGEKSAVTYTTSDKFSVPKDPESQAALKTLTGDYFSQWFETKRTIALKDSAKDNPTFIAKLVKACEAAGLELGEAFDVTDVLVAKSDLDRHQYQLDAEKLAEFRTLCRQSAPALK
jgi:hypothetical protein